MTLRSCIQGSAPIACYYALICCGYTNSGEGTLSDCFKIGSSCRSLDASGFLKWCLVHPWWTFISIEIIPSYTVSF